MNVIVEEYQNLTAFIDTIGKRGVNSVFSGRYLSSQKPGSDWQLTKTYEEACALAVSGYKEGLNRMISSGLKVTHRETVHKNIPSVNVVGYAPHVANAVVGIPMSMIDVAPVKQQGKVITILYNIDGICDVDAQDFVAAGKNVLNVITTLETQGYRVGLYVMQNYYAGDEIGLFSIEIKNWRQASNPLKVSYPLIHPSFFRRHGFKWLETCPNITDSSFTHGYGCSFDRIYRNKNEMEEFLREQGILKQGWFFLSREEATNNNADALIKRLGLDK